MTVLLCLLCQSTALLSLGLLALYLTRRFGPSVQSLVGRASLASVALLLLLAPLTGHIRPVVRVQLPQKVQEPTPQQHWLPGGQAATLPIRSNAEGHKREDEELPPVGGPLAAPSPTPAPSATQTPPEPPPAVSQPIPAAAPKALEPAQQEGAASSPPTLARLYPSFRKDPASEERGSKAVGLLSLLLLLWLGVCQFHLTRLRCAARPVTDGPAAVLLAELTAHPPALLTHPSVHSPFLAGLRRPAIFLPPAFAADFAPDALRAVFLHELAHRDRRDNLWTLAARLLTAALWFQPLLWLLGRKLEQISEDACDQAVLAAHCPPRAYAACLLSLAERPPLTHSQRTLTAGVAPFRSSVGRRISRILTTRGVRPMPPLTLRLRLTAAALTIAAALGSAFLVSSAPAQSTAAAPFVPTPQELRHEAEQKQDLQNLKEIGLAIRQYTQDNNERFPDAAHWMDQITPYLEGYPALLNPFQPGQKCYGYAFNRNCSGKFLSKFDAPAETVAVFDSALGTRNASDTGASLRINPALDRSQGVRIFPAGSNYVFIDGHTNFFMPHVHPSFSLAGGMPSIDGNDHDILGSWVSPGLGAAETALIFSRANVVEKVGPWPGDTRKIVHFYGRYNAHLSDLKYIFTRVWVEGKPMYTMAPEKHLVGYALSADGQTMTFKDKPVLVYHRSSTYSRHKPKGFLWI